MKKLLLCFILIFYSSLINAENISPAITATISEIELMDFSHNSDAAKKLISLALELTRQKLTYAYGSADPSTGGMDCSGTIYYLLHKLGINDAPRQANQMYLWVNSHLHVVSASDFAAFDFDNLKPGDLLFWTGTYAVKRIPPITHVMIYIGKNKQGRQLMVGASDGRTYLGKKMWGVSVFDFKLTSPNTASHFVGYSCIPGLTCYI
jgi:cell wall-associated NlpC family hydrolase